MFAQSNKNIPEIPLKSHQIPQTARLHLPWLPLKSAECEALRLDRDDNRGIVTISQSTNGDGFSEVRHKSFFLQRNEIIGDGIITKEGLAFSWTHLLETIPRPGFVLPENEAACLMEAYEVGGVNIKVFIAIRFNTRHNTLIFFYTHRQSGPQARVLCFDTASS